MLDGLRRQSVTRLAFFAGKVKQDHRYARIDTVCGNLRTHHARTEHGNFFYDEIRHGLKPPTIDIFFKQAIFQQRWVPACAGIIMEKSLLSFGCDVCYSFSSS
jgi:hypothetical protein